MVSKHRLKSIGEIPEKLHLYIWQDGVVIVQIAQLPRVGDTISLCFKLAKTPRVTG